MPVIELETFIAAPPERVFDLSRSIDAHQDSTTGTGERAVDGVTSGLIEAGEQVTWSARHFGVRQRLTVRITDMERPRFFRDEMLRGAFASMHHVHTFEPRDGGTLVGDRFEFRAPLGVLGRVAERLFLTAYMRRFLVERNAVLRRIAESDEWRRYLDTP